MVLHTRGRVGSRHFYKKASESNLGGFSCVAATYSPTGSGTPERERLSVVNVLEGCRTRLVQGTEWSEVPLQKALSAKGGNDEGSQTSSGDGGL